MSGDSRWIPWIPEKASRHHSSNAAEPIQEGRVVDADGTQAPEPSEAFGDPVAGSTDGKLELTDGKGAGAGEDPVPDVETTGPVLPDPEVVRRMVEAAMAAEERAAEGGSAEEGSDGAKPSISVTPRELESEDDTRRQERAWRQGRSQLLPPLLRLRHRGGLRRTVRRPAQPPRGKLQPMRKPSTGAAGLAVALVLLVAFVLVAIQLVVSISESISAVFS
jgi:hypothetical protein